MFFAKEWFFFPGLSQTYLKTKILGQILVFSTVRRCTTFPRWLNLLVLLSHLTLTVNSSVNFLIYIAFSRDFQQAARGLVARGGQGVQGGQGGQGGRLGARTSCTTINTRLSTHSRLFTPQVHPLPYLPPPPPPHTPGRPPPPPPLHPQSILRPALTQASPPAQGEQEVGGEGGLHLVELVAGMETGVEEMAQVMRVQPEEEVRF